jgi:hypothetical protein
MPFQPGQKPDPNRPRKTGGIMHTIRDGKGGFETFKITRKTAINKFCMKCMGKKSFVKDCTDQFCEFYPFRPYKRSDQTMLFSMKLTPGTMKNIKSHRIGLA